MARSTYIYVVTELMTDKVAAAFTVKHELISWMDVPPAKPWFQIWRVPDGAGRDRIAITEMTEEIYRLLEDENG